MDTKDFDGDVYSMFLGTFTNHLHDGGGEVGGSGLVVTEQESPEEVFVEDGHGHEDEDEVMSAESPAVKKSPKPRSNAASESLRDSSLADQLNAPALSLHSSLGTQFKQSSAPSTWLSTMSLGQVEKTSAATSMSEVHQPSSSSRDVSDDIESIASIPDSIGSIASTSHSLGQAAVNLIVAKFTQCDPELNKLYTEASQQLTQARFVDNNRRLLKLFHLDIAQEAKTAPQVEAASFFKSRRSRSDISECIFQRMIPDEQPPVSFKQREKGILELGRYINALEPKCNSSDVDSEIGSDHHEESPSAESLKATVDFLVTSQAFTSYRQRLHKFIWPSHKEEHGNAGLPPRGATMSDSQSPIHHEKRHKGEDPKIALAGDEVSRDEALEKDRIESQNKVVFVETPAIAEPSDLHTNLTSESFDEDFQPSSQDTGLELPRATNSLSTRVRKWVIDRLWPPQNGSKRIWYLCVSIHFSSNSSNV